MVFYKTVMSSGRNFGVRVVMNELVIIFKTFQTSSGFFAVNLTMDGTTDFFRTNPLTGIAAEILDKK